jgi:hypothetical protein
MPMHIRAPLKLTAYDLKKEIIYRITTTIMVVSPVGATAVPTYPSTFTVVEAGVAAGAIPVGAGALAGAGDGMTHGSQACGRLPGIIPGAAGAPAGAGAGAAAGAGAIPVGAGATRATVGATQAMDGAIPTTGTPDMSIAAGAITIVTAISMPSEAVP